MEEKYGFVYIWYDRKHKRFYIGCHWGTEDDGYVCSSSWMKTVYKNRPDDFKRRIIQRIYTNKKDLLTEEYKWLSKIKKDELKTRYYNIHNHHFSHWSTHEGKRQSVINKCSNALTGRTLSEESIQKRTATRKETYLGHSEETKLKMSEKAKGRPKSDTHKESIRQVNLGKKYSNETNKKKGRTKKYLIKTPDGFECCVNGLQNFCKEINISATSFMTTKSTKGWVLVQSL